MKVLVIGGGGREHALVWRLRQSPLVERLWCAPGNAGISDDAECVPVDAGDADALLGLAERLKPDLTVIGPEAPLVAGARDKFDARRLRLIGPSQRDAQLEGSKIFAKEFMTRHGIPTAAWIGGFDSPTAAIKALQAVDPPVVVKADGLCAGKGVLVAETRSEAEAFIRRLMEQQELGSGGLQVLLEQALEGEELSFIILTDGEAILPMVPTRDHKRVFDGDHGPNTGGMGAYSTDGMVSAELGAPILGKIVRPTIEGLRREGLPYTGFLYFGLMLTAEGPKVLEYNCRLGDPEAQAIMMRMDFDLAAALEATASRKLGGFGPKWKRGASVCVVMASGGYPGLYETGKRIEGLDAVKALPDVAVFHAGTRRQAGSLLTSGGRVLGVTAAGASLEEALRKAYAAVEKIHFEGAHYRADIGEKRTGRRRAAEVTSG